ncbi:hypothetical protein CR513_20874, partial [Mucuna pruriens]
MKKQCPKYGYLYLIHEKFQSLDVFKSFKVEVELQLGKKIKAIKSNHGGEYYGRYDGSGEQRPRPFALFLKEFGIILKYTMPNKPSMNDVAERQNQTLKDMMRIKARPYRPCERKLDSRTVSCYFVDYVERSQGYKFYDSTLRSFFKTGNARILKEVEFEKEENIRNVVFEEEFVNDIGQFLVPITIQETTLVIGNNVQTIIPNIVREQDYDEASRKWYHKFHQVITSYGFEILKDRSQGCEDSKRFTSGYIYMLAGGAISWNFVKQTLIAPSTMTVEFVACFEASNHRIWLRNFVTKNMKPKWEIVRNL